MMKIVEVIILLKDGSQSYHLFYTYEKGGFLMKITYYGHSCFLVEENNSRICLIRMKMAVYQDSHYQRYMCVDAVYCSRMNMLTIMQHILFIQKNKEPFPKEFIVVPHDHHDGKKRGMNRMTVVNIHGIRLAHLGDIGRLPTKEEYEN